VKNFVTIHFSVSGMAEDPIHCKYLRIFENITGSTDSEKNTEHC